MAETNGYAISPTSTSRHGARNSHAVAQSRPSTRRQLSTVEDGGALAPMSPPLARTAICAVKGTPRLRAAPESRPRETAGGPRLLHGRYQVIRECFRQVHL